MYINSVLYCRFFSASYESDVPDGAVHRCLAARWERRGRVLQEHPQPLEYGALRFEARL